MTRVNSADQVLLLLRERLQRLDRARGKRAGKAEPARSTTGAPVARLQALAGLEGLTEDELRRTLVRALLAEELGEAVAGDPRFAAIADEVYRMISASDEGRSLIEDASRDLTDRR